MFLNVPQILCNNMKEITVIEIWSTKFGLWNNSKPVDADVLRDFINLINVDVDETPKFMHAHFITLL